MYTVTYRSVNSGVDIFKELLFCLPHLAFPCTTFAISALSSLIDTPVLKKMNLNPPLPHSKLPHQWSQGRTTIKSPCLRKETHNCQDFKYSSCTINHFTCHTVVQIPPFREYKQNPASWFYRQKSACPRMHAIKTSATPTASPSCLCAY